MIKKYLRTKLFYQLIIKIFNWKYHIKKSNDWYNDIVDQVGIISTDNKKLNKRITSMENNMKTELYNDN